MVTMILGCPAGGKSSLVQAYTTPNTVRLNRDTEGGSTAGLLPKFVEAIRAGKDVVMDNVFATALSRKSFIEAAKKYNTPITCVWLNTSIEEAQINALRRMWANHGKLFWTAADMKGIKDPGLFPIAVLYKYRKEFQPPTTSEGFTEIKLVKFQRIWEPEYNRAAMIFDYDGTLRTVNVNAHFRFPIGNDEIVIPPGVRPKLAALVEKENMLLLGASNQSGIAKGDLTEHQARLCFDYTNRELGVDIDYAFCPHSVPPISCYCRKPSSGIPIYFIEKYKLRPDLCTFVGGQTTDRTCAGRVGFQYATASEFFE